MIDFTADPAPHVNGGLRRSPLSAAAASSHSTRPRAAAPNAIDHDLVAEVPEKPLTPKNLTRPSLRLRLLERLNDLAGRRVNLPGSPAKGFGFGFGASEASASGAERRTKTYLRACARADRRRHHDGALRAPVQLTHAARPKRGRTSIGVERTTLPPRQPKSASP